MTELWSVVLEWDGEPAATEEDARLVLAQLEIDDSTLEPETPEDGGWLLALPDDLARVAERDGTAFWYAPHASLSVSA